MYIVKLKGCRRCGGDLFLESETEDTSISCLQCGATYVLRRKAALKPGRRKVAVAR